MSAIFLPEDVRELLKGKTVIYIGDSVQRSMYKDLVLLFQEKRYLTDQELRAKGELCFLGDELMEGGRKGEMTNSTKYREVRKFLFDSQTKVLYFFITACFGEYIEMVLKKLMKPDIIFMNSCLWDVHRYGTKGYEGYGPNLRKLVRLLKDLHPSVLFAWTTTPPVDIRSKAGFLEDRKDLVKINEVLRCNDIARQIMSQEDIPIADFADVFRHFTHHRANDGVHWNERAHRRMTNILLETVARHCNRPVPRPVGDDFNRNLDFDDRPPFPHSFSQPAFHHNDSWGSIDDFSWYNDRFINDSAQDDFILGLDRSYGYGNYSFFEMEEEMPPRFMPPPGRRMPPHSLRGPPPPPGYRFGTGDPGMMWEGRKRKTREDDMSDGYSKRQYIEDNRGHAGSCDRKTPSPLVENKSKLDGSRKSLSPDLDEKPFNSTLAVNKKEPTKSPTIDVKQPHIELNSPKEGKAGFSEAVGDLEMEISNIKGVSVKNDATSSDPPVPDDERKAVAIPPKAISENSSKREEASESDIKESSAGILPGPCGLSVDKATHDLENEIVIADEKPGLDSKPWSGSENTTNSDEKSTVSSEKSVFARLSSTTAMILQSIQNSSKTVFDVMHASDKSVDSQSVQIHQDVKDEKDEKNIEHIAARIILEEKSSVAVTGNMPSVTAMDTKISPSLLQNAKTESLGKGKQESLVSTTEDEIKIREKNISYYDMEETFDDLVASLDKMEDDGPIEPVDFDEESLLLGDIDQVPSSSLTNSVTMADVDVAQKTGIGNSSNDGGIDEQLEKKRDVLGMQDISGSLLIGRSKSLDDNLQTCNSSGGNEAFTASAANLVDSKKLDKTLDLTATSTVENIGRIPTIDAKESGPDSGRDTLVVSQVIPQKENELAKERMTDVAASTGHLLSSSNLNVAKVNVPVANLVRERCQPLSSSEGLIVVHTSGQHPTPVINVPPSTSAMALPSANLSGKATGSVANVKGLSVPFATSAVVASCGAKSLTVPFVNKDIAISGNAETTSTPVSNNVTSVTFSEKASQPAKIGENMSKSSFGAVLTQTGTTAQIGTQTCTVVSSFVKSAVPISLRNKSTPIGTKTVTVPLGAKTTPIASPGVDKLGGSIKRNPVVTSLSNTPASLVANVIPTSPMPTTLLDSKPKLPCVPNPPSLDMKSPFYKPKITTKSSDLSGSPSKLSTVKVHEPLGNINLERHSQKEQPEQLPHGENKSIGTDANKTPSKVKTKVKKKKKVGKKGSKKTATDGEGVNVELKGAKSGGVKKKSKKDGKVKKKKLKDKIKNKVLSEEKNIGKSLENVTQTITHSTKDLVVNTPQSITTIASKDRPKARQQHNDSSNRTKRLYSQPGVSPSGNIMNNFVPQAPQAFQPQQQQQQQPLGNAQQYFLNQQTFAPINPQPQVPLVQQFPYGQQVYANQNSSLGYVTGLNAIGTNAVFGVSPALPAGYQQMNYYDNQTAIQMNGTNLHSSATNPNQSKEYQHLAWL